MKKYAFVFGISILAMAPSFAQDTIEPYNNSNIAFTIPEKDLIPESIAYDPATGSFFMGSTRKGKIIRRDRNGNIMDFGAAKQHGMWMVIGLKIDIDRRILWACSSGGDNLEDYSLKDDQEGRPAGIFKYDLDSGKLLGKFIYNAPGEVHFFNDIAIAPNGDVFVTHMFQDHAIYRIKNGSETLEKVYTSDVIQYPNGIAFSENGEKLYVAHSDGIALINISSGEISPLEIPDGLKISRRESIDGLYFYKNSLVGIQSDINTVNRLFLDENGSKIIRSQPLEIKHPMMDTPTTGEIVKDEFYYIANAQFGKFDENGLLPMHKLYEPVILKVRLDYEY
ncbi:SMP-30/gluconolactonase/LRE family protein [Flagellimonas marina]|uniref:SMP-30/gluconolactonase/LRE family protein n=1 Tax=Flagellimonas marina TaxID=1775168 RepID=A0ABV8PHH0_9FLAO